MERLGTDISETAIDPCNGEYSSRSRSTKPQQQTPSIRVSESLREFLELARDFHHQRSWQGGVDIRRRKAPPAPAVAPHSWSSGNDRNEPSKALSRSIAPLCSVRGGRHEADSRFTAHFIVLMSSQPDVFGGLIPTESASASPARFHGVQTGQIANHQLMGQYAGG